MYGVPMGLASMEEVQQAQPTIAVVQKRVEMQIQDVSEELL
jgi:hypothetical protein